MNFTEHSIAETPAPGEGWRTLPATIRLDRIRATLASEPRFSEHLEAVDARQDGEIILRFVTPVGAGQRGGLLLDFESRIKDAIDRGLHVWLEPLGDRSSLRRLRGILVKQ
jgi:hypothetical protein